MHQSEGAIVEFSAFESPIGKPSWKFQIFQVQADGSRLLLQEISGSGPQYNQSFWNGRKKFFGASYPAGKYMFTVTAADVEGRETSLTRLLLVRPSPQEEKAQQAKAAAQKTAVKENVATSGLRSRTLSSKGALKGAKGGSAGKTLKSKKGAAPRKAPAKKAAASRQEQPEAEAEADAPAESAPPGELSGQVSYKIYFTEQNALTNASEKRLAQVAETMRYYPMSNIQLTGFAYSGEPNADTLAENRVNAVAARLESKYKVDRSRMEMVSKVTEANKAVVEIKLTGNE